jgi:DNA-binding MarR family transcriptional regulator
MDDIDHTALLVDLIAVEVRLFDAADAELRRSLDMPLIAFFPLRVVATTPGCRVQDLVDRIGITVGGASKSVDRLERQGWVRRVPHPHDRRSSTIELTASGADVLAAATTVVAEETRRGVSQRLSDADVRRLATVLADLRGSADPS